MLTRRAAIFTSLAFAAIPAPANAAADLVLPLDLSGPRPALLLRFGDGPEESWVFDTGAAGGVIEIGHAQALGLPNLHPARVGSPAGGTPVEGFATRVSGARVGNVTLPEFSAIAMPFPAHVGAGIVSPAAFAGRLVTLDLAHAQLRIHDRNGAPPADAARYIGTHPLPGIAVTVNGVERVAHMDTGAPGGLIFPYAMASELPLAAPPRQVGVARLIDAERPRYEAQLTAPVQVGPLTLQSPVINMVDGLPDVNVGGQILRELLVTLDPEARLAWATLAS